jgi:hypothetical protein
MACSSIDSGFYPDYPHPRVIILSFVHFAAIALPLRLRPPLRSVSSAIFCLLSRQRDGFLPRSLANFTFFLHSSKILCNFAPDFECKVSCLTKKLKIELSILLNRPRV